MDGCIHEEVEKCNLYVKGMSIFKVTKYKNTVFIKNSQRGKY